MLSDPKETTDRSGDFPIARQALNDILGDHLARLAEWHGNAAEPGRSESGHTSVDIDAETQARLRALGYMDN